MVDYRLRQIIREYSLEPTEENLETLLGTYIRNQVPLDIFESAPLLASELPLNSPYIVIDLIDKNEELIWWPWGLEEEDLGNKDAIFNVLAVVFKDIGLSYPPAGTSSIDYAGFQTDDPWVFINFEPYISREYIVQIVDSLNKLSSVQVAEAKQKFDERVHTYYVPRLEELQREGYPYSANLIHFLNIDAPIWEYPGDPLNQILPFDMQKDLESVKIPVFSRNSILEIINSPYAEDLNLYVKNKPLETIVKQAIDSIITTSWESVSYQPLSVSSNHIYKIESFCFDIKSWTKNKNYAEKSDVILILVSHNVSIDIGEAYTEFDEYLTILEVSNGDLTAVNAVDLPEDYPDTYVEFYRDLLQGPEYVCLPNWMYPAEITSYQQFSFPEIDDEII